MKFYDITLKSFTFFFIILFPFVKTIHGAIASMNHFMSLNCSWVSSFVFFHKIFVTQSKLLLPKKKKSGERKVKKIFWDSYKFYFCHKFKQKLFGNWLMNYKIYRYRILFHYLTKSLWALITLSLADNGISFCASNFFSLFLSLFFSLT